MHQHRRGAEPLGRRGDLAHPVGRGRIDHQRHGDPTGADDRIGDGMRRLRIGPAAVQCGARVGDHDGEPLRAEPAGDGRADAAPMPRPPPVTTATWSAISPPASHGLGLTAWRGSEPHAPRGATQS
jgi:hypothetical protein